MSIIAQWQITVKVNVKRTTSTKYIPDLRQAQPGLQHKFSVPSFYLMMEAEFNFRYAVFFFNIYTTHKVKKNKHNVTHQQLT